ncbi:hypothetical protein GOZ90_16260 [Agrobacterium vitis]|uniref:Uncharacterized protein n=1 Tax=Agrobacterium vitis TaxID=373 RepID=A0A6L6VLF1_AGRVI|nr:hypothetical protein [Agrobacterium vitis]MUZ74242.1 hypothetical protein [Agrobacterium vitis]MVA56064.1 hypothetical protein [Agrobacterium vitis]
MALATPALCAFDDIKHFEELIVLKGGIAEKTTTDKQYDIVSFSHRIDPRSCCVFQIDAMGFLFFSQTESAAVLRHTNASLLSDFLEILNETIV